MRILGIDTSGMTASVAILEDECLIGEYTVNFKKTHSQTLLPMLDELLTRVELSVEDMDAIATAAGPGSFTGLRIGAATVKGLAMPFNTPVIEVSSLEALAYQCCGSAGLVCPIFDARRSQTYAAAYEFDGNEAVCVIEPSALMMEEFIEKLNIIGKPAVFTGDGVPVFAEMIKEKAGFEASFAPAHRSRQSAAAVAYLGMKKMQKGESVAAADHRPIYLRIPQAERELAEKNDNKKA